MRCAFEALGLPSNFSEVRREWKNTDLAYIFPHGQPPLIFENKSGSLPTDKQLKKYNKIEGTQKDRFILFSPLHSDEYLAKSIGWGYRSYKDLSDKLRTAIVAKYPTKSGMEYDFILLVLDYMTDLYKDTDDAINSVEPATTIRNLTNGIEPRRMCVDETKKKLRRELLGYAAISSSLNEKLKESGATLRAALGQDMNGHPMVEIKKKFTDDVTFHVQFQQNHLSLGFSKMEKDSDKRTKIKAERIEVLTKTWKEELGAEEKLKKILRPIDGKFPKFPILEKLLEMEITRGYLAKTYTMPMLHLKEQLDMTVGELTDIMAAIGMSAEKVAAEKAAKEAAKGTARAASE